MEISERDFDLDFYEDLKEILWDIDPYEEDRALFPLKGLKQLL